jgi:hypothetical protein
MSEKMIEEKMIRLEKLDQEFEFAKMCAFDAIQMSYKTMKERKIADAAGKQYREIFYERENLKEEIKQDIISHNNEIIKERLKQ